MKQPWKKRAVVAAILAMLVISPWCFAGSDRWIMAMTTGRMDKSNLVFVRFFGPDGAALESDALKQMVIRVQDCSSGKIFEMSKDYRMGYAPKNMLLGIYLSPFVWYKKSLCFNVPGLGKIVQSLDPAANNSRSFQLQMTP